MIQQVLGLAKTQVAPGHCLLVLASDASAEVPESATLLCLQIQQEFGMSMYRLEETIIDMAVSLIQLGIATPKLKPGF